MEFLELVYRRRTVRAFTDDPVERDTLMQLMQVAVQAPTGMNLQPWAFGVVTGAVQLRDLSDRAKAFLLDNLEQFPALARYREMFAEPATNLCYGAPALIVIFAKPNGVTPAEDCAMAAQNLMLAACDLGLGSCWVGFLAMLLNQPEQKRALGIPEDYRIVAPIVVGRPLGDIPPVEKAAPEVLFWQA